LGNCPAQPASNLPRRGQRPRLPWTAGAHRGLAP